MFFGREGQIEQLEALWRKRVGSLVTCRGRRRIGKSTLIEQFAKKTASRFIKIEGIKPKPKFANENELEAFAMQLAAQTGADPTPPGNWLNAFIRLNDKIRDDERTVVLLDEVSWLGHYDEMFADTLRIAWENYWKKHDRLIVVLCGSVSTWIRENVIDNSAYLGRRSLDLVVGELPLKECVRFWGAQAERIAAKEIVDILSVTGGVPRYLEEIDPGLSADENLKRMCYSPNSILRMDFDEMFNDVITNQPRLTADVLRTLVDGPLSATEISAALQMEKGGRVSAALFQLSEAGFVCGDAARNPETGAAIRERRYRLSDNYSRYYLKFVERVTKAIDSGSYAFTSLSKLSGWDTVMGLQFENLVVNHYTELLPHLHLGGTVIMSAAPYRKIGRRDRNKGCQVDLLLQAENMLYFVEAKRQQKIETSVVWDVDEKIRRVSRPTGVSARAALVYDGELAPSIETDGYFDAVVPFAKLLGL